MARSAITKPQLRRAGDLTITGLDGILDNLNNILDKTSAENLKGIFMDAGRVPQARAKAIARPHYKTGNLDSNIYVAPGKKDAANVIFGVNTRKAPEGMWLEYGVKQSASPYFRPAITESRPEMGKIIITGTWKTIEDAVK